MIQDARYNLRQQLLDARKRLPPVQRMAAAEAMAEHLLERSPWRHPTEPGKETGYVAGYWAVRGEMSLHSIVARGSRDFIYCLPCIEAGSRLRFAPWRLGDDVAANRFGIPEPIQEPSSRLAPEDLSVALLPLVGFDRRGNRLGSGAGYYDRSFAFRRGRAADRPLLIGIAYAAQELPRIEAADWDVPLDAVVTENGVIDCAAERASQQA